MTLDEFIRELQDLQAAGHGGETVLTWVNVGTAAWVTDVESTVVFTGSPPAILISAAT
jgi:hypothetical protein